MMESGHEFEGTGKPCWHFAGVLIRLGSFFAVVAAALEV